MAGLFVIAALSLLFLLGPLVWSVAPQAQNLSYGPNPPTLGHPFGTDAAGRDLLAR